MCTGGVAPGRRVLNGDPRAPLEVGDERRSELRVGREARLVGALAHQLHPASPLRLGQGLTHVLGDHPVVAAVLLAVGLRPAERLCEPRCHPLGVIG